MNLQHDITPPCAAADPDDFHPPEDYIGNAVANAHRRAKLICNGIRQDDGTVRDACPFRDACLEMALSFEGEVTFRNRWGVFGGRDPLERAAIAAQRRKAKRTAA